MALSRLLPDNLLKSHGVIEMPRMVAGSLVRLFCYGAVYLIVQHIHTLALFPIQLTHLVPRNLLKAIQVLPTAP